jgi:hypothetical protein
MPDDLTRSLPQSASPTKPTWPDLSPALRALLLAADDGQTWGRIVNSPALVEECRRVWEPLGRAATAPAGEEGVIRVIAKRFPVFPQPERSPGEWDAWWSNYFDALEDLPEEALEAGMRAYLREPDAEFLPKPGRLRELARQSTTPTAKAAGLAARCAAYTPPTADHGTSHIIDCGPRRMPTADERKREVAAARETCQRLAETASKQQAPPRQWFTPKTDETGLTETMRAHMAGESSR